MWVKQIRAAVISPRTATLGCRRFFFIFTDNLVFYLRAKNVRLHNETQSHTAEEEEEHRDCALASRR